jgi:small-conductance mechanosensitive channel
VGEAFDRIVTAAALPFGGLGVLVAVALVVAMRMSLRPVERRRLRAPLRLLVTHLSFVLLAVAATDGSGLQRFAQLGALLSLLVCIGRASFVLLLDTVLGRRFARPIPKIFRDILEGLVYTGAVLATLRAAGAELDALLTTSALLTAVIGLSLQDTLGNLFAGLSIQAQNPFEVGDWIQYGTEEDTLGRVHEINWRATKVVTLDDIEVVIPNGTLAKAPILNFTKPSGFARRSVRFVVPFDTAPRRVHRVVLPAIRHVDGVLAEPGPSILTEQFTERGVQYWLRYYTNDFALREQIDGNIRDRVWYALRRAGIEIAVPIHDVDLRHENEQAQQQAERELDRRRRALRGVDFCAKLTDAQIDELARATRTRLFAPGEIVIREGARGEELFIVERGELAVSVAAGGNGRSVEVARLKSGGFFGEMSVMTGEPRSATVRAVGECTLLVVGKAGFQSLLDASPQTAELISEALAARQEQLDSASSKPSAPIVLDGNGDRSHQLLGRIRDFFSL